MSTNQEIKKQTEVERRQLSGHVKSIKTLFYQAFTRNGNIYLGALSESYHPDANTELQFYENGNLKKNVKTTEHSFYEHFHNEKGLMVKSISTYKNIENMGYVAEYFYDENDLQVEHRHSDKNNNLNIRRINEYDDLKREVHSIEYDKDGNINSQHFRFYDDGGRQIEFKQIDKNDIATYWQKTEYNLKGHTLNITDLNPDSSVKKFSDYTHYLDANGDHIKHPPSSPKGNSKYYKTEIETDHHQNWIRKINYYNNAAYEILARYITYYNEEEPQKKEHHSELFEMPFTLKNPQKVETDNITVIEFSNRDQDSLTQLKPEDAKWLADKNNNSLLPENFSLLAYYITQNNDYPSQVTYNPHNGGIEAIVLLKELKSYVQAEVIYSYCTDSVDYGETLHKYVLRFPEHPGYLLSATNINNVDEDEYEVPEFIYESHRNDNFISISQIILLRPSDASMRRDENGIEENIKYCIERCKLNYKPDQPEIYMVEVSGSNFHLQSHPVNNDFEIKDLDVNYGYGFGKFHSDLMQRFTKENKGLVLFHGEPGTGKTFYIRHLLKEMASSKKRVIYMPPNMVDYLVEPNFVTFLSKTVKNYSLNGEFCVLLIEDAEPLLVARGGTETRIQGITNLLNMTDGLLNDMMKLQIICTFNVGLKKLDAALLRPGRLIARKEFKALGELDANLLAQRLGIKHHFTKPTTLSEIYSMLQNKNTIIHEGGE